MLRTSFRLVGLPLACLLAISGFFALDPSKSETPPDVLLITIDTLRADHVGAWGARGAATPVLDRLAREGARFERVMAPVPLTLPTHTTILTGLLPPSHGVRHNGLFRLEDGIPTLSERLRRAGWSTAAVVAARILDRRFGLERGFDHYDDAVEGERATIGGSPERPANEVSDAAIARIQSTPGPLFLWLHYYDVHAEYQPPSPFAERFPGDPYSGEVAWVDSQVGRVIDALRDSGRLDRTLVAVTADHGESLGSHGEATHGHTLFDASLHVPWILRGPGVPAGRIVEGPVSLASLTPTLLGLLDQPALLHADGADLGPQLAGAPLPLEASAYSEALAGRLDHGIHPVHSVRSGRYRYVHSARPELYDLSRDPRETRNLLAEPTPGQAARAERDEDAIQVRLAGSREGSRTPLDAELSAQLEALGYAMGDAGAAAASDLDYKDALPSIQGFMQARAAHLKGDVEVAAQRLTPLIEKLPGSPRVQGLAARLAAKRGDLPAALAHAENAAELAPDSHRAWLLVGDLHAVMVARDAAGPAWKRAAELGPDEAGVHLRVADWHDRRDEAEAALASYRTAAANSQDEKLSATSRLGAAVQMLRLGRSSEAYVALQSEVSDPTADTAMAHRLADAWRGRGQDDRAAALWRRVLAARPDHAGARMGLARLGIPVDDTTLPPVAAPPG